MSERRYRLLVVDDSSEDRARYRHALTHGGGDFEIAEAETGAAGLALCRAFQPDCVLLDDQLPDVDGLELLAALIHDCGSDPRAVLVLTGQGNETAAVRALKAGAEDYLVKGTALDHLPQAVRAAIEKVALRRQVEVQRQELERHLTELALTDQRKDQFLAMLAHELRNPLAPIKNALHVLKLRGADWPAVEQVHAMIERQVGHLARLIDDLLDVSRITRGKVTLKRERLDLAQLVREGVNDHRRPFETAGVILRTHAPDTPVWVTGDATRLTQIVDNFLTNAVKFTNPGGAVDVTVAAEPRQARLTVRDSGIGIEPAILPTIFDVFAQADQGLDRSRGGMGLGLAIVRGLVELHGGTVTAASAGVGQGTEMTVLLPQADQPAGAATTPPLRCAPDRHRRILIVEDSRDSAESLGLLLQMHGYEVRLAHTGADGIDAARSWLPDAIVCDIGLPGVDGFSVAQQLRADPATAAIRLIAVTGYGRDEDRKRARAAGFDDYLVKPADPEKLLEKLATLEA